MNKQELAALNSRIAVALGFADVWTEEKGKHSGYTPAWGIDDETGDTIDKNDWKPTTDHNHAAMVKEAMVKRGFFWLCYNSDASDKAIVCEFSKKAPKTLAGIKYPSDYLEGYGRSDTEALAIVQAALLAIEALKGVGDEH